MFALLFFRCANILFAIMTIVAVAINAASCAEGAPKKDKSTQVLVIGPGGKPLINRDVYLDFSPPGPGRSSQRRSDWVSNRTDSSGLIEIAARQVFIAAVDDERPRYWHRFRFGDYYNYNRYFYTRTYPHAVQIFPKYDPDENVQEGGRHRRYASEPFSPQKVRQSGDYALFVGPLPELNANRFTQWECVVRYVDIEDIPKGERNEQLQQHIEGADAFAVMQLWLKMPEGFHASRLRHGKTIPGGLKESALAREVLIVENIVTDRKGYHTDFQGIGLIVQTENEAGGVANYHLSGNLSSWGEQEENLMKAELVMTPNRYNNNGWSLVEKEPEESKMEHIEDAEIRPDLIDESEDEAE